jgi:hypothetical protein
MYFDIAMPLTLLGVTLVSLFLNQKTESKLKTTFEERELAVKDVVLLVAAMVAMVSLVVFLRDTIAPLMVLFLFSYSMLLFMFTYLFSDKRWYLALLPPIAFVLPYIFLRNTALWTNYLSSVYGVIFAILITLYIGYMFAWKSTIVFITLLTAVDVIQVLITRTMQQAAGAMIGLDLPVVVKAPIIPLLIAEDGSLGMMYLGLGDFFFAGLLAIQTFRRYGRKLAILSVIAMAVSFFVFVPLIQILRLTAFPGTVMIISGWLPLVLWKELRQRKLQKGKL